VAGSGYAPGVEGQSADLGEQFGAVFHRSGRLEPDSAWGAGRIRSWHRFWRLDWRFRVALVASQAGHLAEDVTGNNIIAANGTITGPLDIASSARALRLELFTTMTGR